MMPCMQACAVPEKFDQIVNKATVIVVIIFCTYGTLAYLAFGDSES